jgi:DNA replication licensing factor MCM5
LYHSLVLLPESEEAPHFQLQIVSNEEPKMLRTLKSNDLGALINVNGIIINSGKTLLRGKHVVARCKGCNHEKTYVLTSGFEGIQLPFFCQRQKDQA